ncbi:MAG: hypothetical protein ACR2QC_09025 [Gammaproteobacteria bacterium]
MNREEWKKRILEKIGDAARERRLLNYEDVLLLKSGVGDDDRRDLYEILGEINRESEEGLLLSALIVDRNTGMPGPGFFREFMPDSAANSFKFFAWEAKRIFNHHGAGVLVNYGVLVDADQTSAQNVANFLQKQKHLPVVCQACGKKSEEEWNMTPIRLVCKSQRVPNYYKVPASLGGNRKQHDAADFFLSMAGAVMMERTYANFLLDEIYIMSGDKDFAYLRKFVADYRIKVRCFNNQIREIRCGGKGRDRIF